MAVRLPGVIIPVPPVKVAVRLLLVPLAMVAGLATKLVITGTGGTLTVSTSVAVPVPPALAALMVTLVVPAAAGVPDMRPLAVFTLKPAGRPAALKLVGPLLAVMA